MRLYLIRRWDAERTVCGVFDDEAPALEWMEKHGGQSHYWWDLRMMNEGTNGCKETESGA